MLLETLIDISDKIDSINTSESYSDKCYINGNSLLIPYIKLEIIDKNVIGNQEDRLNLEFSYLILSGLSELNWMGEDENAKKIVGGLSIKKKERFDLIDWFAINKANGGFEIKATFKKLQLFIPNDARIGTDWWTPIETPNFPKNIESKKVADFYNIISFPKKLDNLIDIQSYSILNFNNG